DRAAGDGPDLPARPAARSLGHRRGDRALGNSRCAAARARGIGNGICAVSFGAGRQVTQAKRTVLVTGASGFIGKQVVATLAKSDWQVRAASRDPTTTGATAAVEPVAMPDLSG